MLNKRNVYAVLCTVMVIAASGCGADNNDSSSSGIKMTSNSATEDGQNISLDEAKLIVLTHAGLNENDVTFNEAKLEHDDGTAEYSIEFTAGNTKYEYEIGAVDGKILEFSSEVIPESKTQTQTEVKSSVSSEPTVSTAEQITLDEAKDIALKHSGFSENQVRFIKTELDYDDGTAEYEIEFTADDVKYEYNIGVADGKILEFSSEVMPTQTQADVKPFALSETAGNTAERITLDEAKDIALKHSGFSENQVRFTKAELDYDDGTAEYEIEFAANGAEYEYKIKASTGQITESDVDYD